MHPGRLKESQSDFWSKSPHLLEFSLETSLFSLVFAMSFQFCCCILRFHLGMRISDLLLLREGAVVLLAEMKRLVGQLSLRTLGKPERIPTVLPEGKRSC